MGLCSGAERAQVGRARCLVKVSRSPRAQWRAEGFRITDRFTDGVCVSLTVFHQRGQI